MGSIIDCFFHFLWSPRAKARLKQYLVHLKLYEARLRELKAGIHNLKKVRDAVQHKVDEEDNRYGRGVPVKVKEWIEAVNATIAEYDKFDEEEDHQLAVFDLFKSGYLPKTGLRYSRSRKAFDITRRVNGLLQTANHDTFSYWLGPPSMDAFFHTVGYETFPSRGETMKKIKEALKSPNIGMVGVHGLSGVGKTTLIREVAREALQTTEAAKMFDVVAMVNVTRNPDIRKIQGQIADMLGMKLDEESDIARAARIRRRLKNEKESTLIILDDLWAALDFNVLGIPLEDDDGDGEHSWMKTTKEIPSGYVKEGKTPGEHRMTKTTKGIPSGYRKEGKIPGEYRTMKTIKEIPSGSTVKEGKTPGEHPATKPEENNSAISMIKSRKLPNASNMKTEETRSHYKGCKVLLISESKQVILSQMEGKENSIYFVEVLKEKEAEALFKKMAGIGDRNSEFDKLAVQIANKCNGLPMSIVTTARALKNQSRSVWEDVHRQLERGKLTGTSEFSTKLSYDLLENEDLKYTFLLCARMGPDALNMDLVRYCIGLGFLQGIYTVKEARDRVYALVGKLKMSGLLSDSYSSDHFTMSDIVRSAALSIASEEKQHVFTMTKGKVDEWPDEDKLERYAAISLHHCDVIEGFPPSINCPKLRIFHVNNNDPRMEIPESLFEGMKELRVLILTGITLSPFPSSIKCLTKLRMLCLENCKLGEELSIIGELKKLRILSLSGSDIEKLPVELKHLTKLQIFDISNCSKLGEIPSNVISSLISLEELYMRNTSIQWEVQEQTHQSENASLSELRHLNQLTTLDIQIPNAAHLPKSLFFDKLYSYKIVIGDLNAHSEMDFKMPEKYEASRFLAIQLKYGFDIHSQKGIKMLFERVEHLVLEDLIGVKDIFYRLNLKGFTHLKHLLVVNNSNIQSLINPEERRHPEKAFPRLESLYLHNLENLEKICSCKLSAPSFGKLKVIKINICGKLKNVFSISVVKLLTVLETIEVYECYALKEIVEVETQSNTNEIEVLEFPELRSLTLQSLSDRFVGFYPVSSSKDLFNGKVVVSKLERMELSSIHNCKIWSDQPSLIPCFRNLIHLDVNGCMNLTYLISFPMAKSLVNLQSLFVSECEKMANIFPQEQEQGSHAKIKGSIFPNLKNIKLSSMKSLMEIWNSELPSNSFDKLDTLIIEECDKFINVFPCYVEGMFWSLCNLRVTNCKSMKAVFELDDKKRNDGDVTNLQDVYLETLPKLEHVWKWSKDRDRILELKSLQKMWVHDCHGLENIFPVSIARCLPSLEHLVIRNCFELREIVAKGEGTNTGTSNPDPSFDFPKLTTIKFSELPKLSCFYPGPGDYKLRCPALNDLSIELCDRLEPFRKETTDAPRRPTLFSEEVINKLKCMQIESWHAKSSSSYMGEGNHRRDNLEELCLSRLMDLEILYSFLHRNPNLKSLSLNKCSFTDIVPLKMPSEIENLGVVPKLKSLKLIDLPDLVTIGFERDIILERIEFLILNNCPRLVNMMPSSVSLTHLTNLEVVNCDGLEKLMPLSAAKSLVQLNNMKVIKCESMVEIVEIEEENAEKVDIVFRQLKVLELVSLKNLNCFSKSCVFGFPSLEKLVVTACPKMETFSKEVKSAPLLQKIFVLHEKEKKIWHWKDDLNTTIREIFKEKKFIEGMDEMSLSEHHDLQQAWHRGGGDGDLKSWFYSLKTLKLEGCEHLSCAIPSYILPHLKSLKELEVRNCDKVKVIFEKTDNETTPSQLKILTLEGLSELEYVWEKNCQGNLIFQNLQQVLVTKCESLQTLFPVALAKNLKKLEKLDIDSCKKLLEIIGKEADAAEKFAFPCLSWLYLYYLPELAYFYPGTFSMECPELHKLLVLECPKLELFQTTLPEGGGGGSSISIDRQPLFSDLKAISILEELSIDWKHILVLKSRLQEAAEDLKFLFLKEIYMYFDVDCNFNMDDNKEPNLSFDMLEKAPNLQDMTIGWCDSLKVFLTQNCKISELGILGQLKILTLNRVSQLQYIDLENSWVNTVFEKLHKLNVSDCPDLTKLLHSPSAISFSCLKELDITECHGLKYLFISSVAEVLIHLEVITVKESQSITEIVAKEQDGTTLQEIEFKWLYCIYLDSLPSLECFYSGNDTLQLPSLIQVDIRQCPKMEVFSRGEINGKSFRGIQASSDPNDELVFHDDLNTSVKRAILLQMLSEGMDEMSFSKHPELLEAWQNGLSLQNNWFYSLRTLKLDNCDFKQYAIPSNILPCLKNLKELEVRNCNKLEVIFEMKDTEIMETVSQLKYLTLEGLPELTLVWEKNCQGILRFRNLQEVSVSGCESLLTLFHAALAENLKKLEKLEIMSCDQLQEIVEKEDAATDVTKKFAFPRLTSLYLYNLPELTFFYPEIFTVECPKLNSLYVLDCPKLELFQGAQSEVEGESSSTSINRQPLFSDLKAISILEELSLNRKHISVLRLGQHREDLKYLNKILLCFYADENEKPIFPLEIFEIARNLQDMTIECCHSLDIFRTRNLKFSEDELLGHLKILKLYKVSELKFIGSEDSSWFNMVCEKLHELNVHNCPDLTTLVHSTSAVCFSNLKKLDIIECHGLNYLFTSSTTKKLIHLENITVKECSSLRKIVAKDEDEAPQGVEFKWLCCINLDSLSSLEYFYSGNDTLQLPSMTQVEIWQCPKMEVFSRGEINAKSFRGIKASSDSNDELVFHNDLNTSVKRVFLLQMLSEGMDEMKFSKHSELQEAWHDGLGLQNNWFYSLKTLKLDNCDFEQYAIPSTVLPCLNNLEELEVRNCNKVKVIFAENDTEAIPSQLNSLTLEGLSELTLVWEKNSQRILRFQNLQQVSVSGCKSMQTLFPAVLAKNLKMLEKLEIKTCDQLREIVGKEEDAPTGLTKEFVFPRLMSMYLHKLPELTYFYPEIFTVEFPKLCYFTVLDCPMLELFQGAHPEGEAESISVSINRQPLIPDLNAIPILEELSLDWKHISVLRLGQHAEDLKYLNKIYLHFDVDENEKPTLPLEILEMAPNLEHMWLGLISSLEIFLTKNSKISEHEILGQLRILTVDNVSVLPYINYEDSWLNTVCEKLRELNVSDCPDLTKLFHSPSAVSFSYLKELNISECHGLKYLFTSSMANKLMHLEEITVKESQSITEIVAKEQDEATSQGIKFERLYCIDLNSLSSLECFYSGNDTLLLPSLTQVDIWCCPKVEVFSRGKINAKSFRGIQASSDSNDELIFHNDLNASVKRVFLLQMLSEGMDEMKFTKHPELQEAWQDGLSLQNNWFYSLKALKLDNCDIEPYAIPSNILPCLMSLKELEVRNCNKVNVIFAENDTEAIPSQLNNLTLEGLSELTLVWEKNCQGILRFQNLQQVSVSGCKSMQTLFPAVLAKNLKMLEKLEIKTCDQLREIVGKEEDAATGLTKKFAFPDLTSLDLSELPELIYFYPEIFTVECRKLSDLSVLDCPKLELFPGAHPEGEAESISTSINRQPLIPDLNAISFLEELYLDWKHISELRLGQHAEDLKYLNKINLHFDVDENEKPTLPFEILEKAPNLEDMRLGLINSLRIFLTQNPEIGDQGILGQLKILTLDQVSELQYINLEDSWLNTVCEKLRELNVSNCPDLTKLFYSPSAVSFSYLKELNISGCHGLKYLFTSSVAKVLLHLEKITVKESQSLTEIVAMEQDGTSSQGIKFERLDFIDLNSLSSLECFYSGNDSLLLPSLTQVDIWCCPKVEVFSRGEINAKSFRGIQASSDSNDELIFYNDLNASVKRVFLLQMLSEGMDGMKFSKHSELQEAWQDGLSLQNNWFYSLKALKLDNCDIEPYAIPSNILPCLMSLKELEVRNCNKVNVIFAENDTEAIPSQLNNLTLEGLSELTLVWEKNCQGILRFQNLQQVSVSGCKSMQTLFPAVLAKNLKMLEKLEIKTCDQLREIVGKEEDAATGLTKKFAFPDLTSLDLSELPELIYFYPEIFTVECRKLSDLSVLDCPKLELFQGAHPEGEAESISTSISRQPLIPDLNAISFLEELYLDWKHISELKLGQHAEDLKYLNKISLHFDVDENERPTLPFEILEKAPNLEDMWLGLINSLGIFLTQNPKIGDQGILGQLRILTVDNVSELQYINLEDSWLNTVCEKLRELNVSDCPDLTQLFHSPSAVSFSYLKELNISGCHGLKYLFTSSVAKVLLHLEKITVKESQSLTEIVAMEQDEATSQGIKFERLYCIDLNSLSSLECFYSGNDTLLLPSLTQVDIRCCPKVEVFSRGEINAKSFRGIQASSDSNDELIFYNDLNASVKRVFLLQMLSEGMDKMKFSRHPELQEAWRDGLGLQNNWFYSLKTLKLDNCDFEQYAIPSTILHCLKNLKELEVRNCNKVKVIFDMNDIEVRETTSQLKYLTLEGLSELTLVWTTNSHGVLRFQNLQHVSVSGCKNLQTLFPEALAKNLKMLEKLAIIKCDELREIVGKEDAATKITKNFEFPCLTSLYLYNLPKLTSFYTEIFILECPNLNNLFVLECPKLELFQGAHLEGEGESISTSITRQPLFSDIKAISILEELSLNWKHISVLRLGQHTEDLKNLNKILLCFYGDENGKPTLPVEILEKAPNLQDLTIECFHSFDIFLAENPKIGEHELLVHLKILKLANVSKLEFIWSKDSSWLNLICEKLHKLNVCNCHDLITLVHSTSAVSFSNLKELDITECDGLNYLFTSSTTKKLMHLEKITVQKCSSMKQIVAKDQDEAPQGIEFMRLDWIVIHSLSSLECFYSGNDALQLPSLTQVDIWQCPNMKIFSEGPTQAKSFRGIKVSSDSNDDLVFYNNDLNASVEKVYLLQQDHLVFEQFILSLKAIWLKSETCPNWGFRNLKSLVLEGCEFLSDAILPSHLLPFLSNLKTLEVRKCNSVKAVFFYTKIGPQGSLDLPNLENLSIENCEKILEIVANGKTATEEANKEIIMFPSLTFLKLKNLGNLRRIYPGMCILEWPMLKELYVTHCPKLKFFATEIQSSRDSHSGSQDCVPTNQQAFVSLKKVTPRLKVLTLGKEEAKMIDQGKLHVDLLELQTLRLQCFHDKKTDVFPFVFHSKALLLPSSIKKLVVRHSAFKEIFPSQTSDTADCIKILSQLEELELLSLFLLKSIGLEHSWMSPFLENLQTIRVFDCACLTNLIPSTVSLSKLRKLTVEYCHGLKYLFTSSTAKTLGVLKEMYLINCGSIIEIVTKEGDEPNEGEIIIFEKLNSLTLSLLPKLGSFYPGSFTLNFPSLKQVSFKQCHSTKIFRLGDRVPDELKVTIDGVRWEGDKNEVIMQLIEEEAA